MFHRVLRFQRRFFHLTRNVPCSVRVRFAPSPTGYIHLGGLRTALYNYLFAKSRNGRFVLRIEDTDRKRLVPGAAAQIERDLDWIGLPPDESPLKGGAYGPYTQSERLALYREAADRLVAEGRAYPCFCSDRRLDAVRKEAERRGAVPRYDNRCRSLSAAAVDEKKRLGQPHCIRFKLGAVDEAPVDLVFGPIDCTPTLHEGDPVILKQDGFPTYHLACVVDDHFMEITHVLRGTEWLVSTPKHVLLYQALGWKAPRFAHLPLIVNADGTKLSKRQGDIRLEHFRHNGDRPEAIVALLCLAGGGFRNTNEIQQRVLSIDELSRHFRIEDMTTHSGRLDMLRLEQFNRMALAQRIRDPTEVAEIVSQLPVLVRQTLGSAEAQVDEAMLDEANLTRILRWAVDQGRVHRVQQLVEPDLHFLWTRPAAAAADAQRRDVVAAVADLLRRWPAEPALDRRSVVPALRSLAASHGLKPAELMKITRTSLTGLQRGPSVGEIIEILGAASCVRRLDAVLAAPDSNSS